MSKLLNNKDKLLFLAAIAGDFIYRVLEEPKRNRFLMYAREYYPAYGRENFLRLWQRVLKTGNMEKVVENGLSYFRLTSRGREKISRKFPLFSLQNKNWDGKWRVVFFDVPLNEKRKREELRRRLKQLGFG
ncbi:MAG: hypothetical protein AAB724_01105, partial [Patescibacteria group bacterium]